MQVDTTHREFIETYAGLEGEELIRAVVSNHPGRVAQVSSFGTESAVLLHMVACVDPSLPIIFLDTQKLFPETIAYRDQLIAQLGLKDVRNITPNTHDITQEDPTGLLHKSAPDRCCYLRKTKPLAEALAGFDALISGRKRFHGAARSALEFVSYADGRLKAEPLAGFTSFDLQSYMTTHKLPQHPLLAQGYLSVGCEPCTLPGGTVDNPRAGRWAGTEKTECGIHFTHEGKPVRVVERTNRSA